MRRVSLARLLVRALLSFLAAGAHAQAKTFAAPPDADRAAWFLDMLKTLADVDGLSDPDKAGAILGVRFRKTVTTTTPWERERSARSFERDEYAPLTRTWFTPGRPRDIRTANGHGAEPVARGNAVNFKYLPSTRRGLPEQDRSIESDFVRDDSETRLVFYGLDKLACVTVQDMEARFPGIDHLQATDHRALRDAERVLRQGAPHERDAPDRSFLPTTA